MKYATVTGRVLEKYPAAEAFSVLAECGFDTLDYRFISDQYRYGVNSIVTGSELELMFAAEHDRNAAEKAGLTMWQLLAPPSVLPIRGREEESKESSRIIRRSIDVAAVIGARYVMVRPGIRCIGRPDDNPELTREMNFHFLSGALEHAISKGIRLALMNLAGSDPTASAQEHAEYVDMMNSPDFAACLDTGNANLSGRTASADAEFLGKRLQVLNLHDNDGTRDVHAYPQNGNVDWPSFFHALQRIGYDGVLSLDCREDSDFSAEAEKRALDFLRSFS